MSITPSPQNLEQVFSSTNYFIDFYQRHYKWSKDPVERLLEDIFYKFNQDYDKICEKDNSVNAETVAARISSYFLNTYVTNTIGTDVYLVDGQQRFTTLTLLFIQLYQLSIKMNSELQEWIKARVYGVSGPNKNFWVHHTKNVKTLEGLLNNKNFSDIQSNGVTGINMINNSKIIKNYLEKEITDLHKFETFIYYLLRKIEILRLEVSQQDVPMVFEVINDRGVRLKPHEILKGKLLGQVDKDELESLELNDIWETQIAKVGVGNDEDSDEIDKFFSSYIRSKVVDTRSALEKYTEKNYHKALFENESNLYFKLHRNPAEIKRFIQNDFVYFTNLYCKIRDLKDIFQEEYQHLYFNFLNDLSNIYILILSSTTLSDKTEDDKIKKVSYDLDRIFSLLQLQKADSNNLLTDLIYKISSEIRDKEVDVISIVFNKYLIDSLKTAKNAEVTEVFNYNYFKDVGYSDLNTRFNRYFLARIEYFLTKNAGAEMQNNFNNLVRNNGYANGHHIEHILSHNEENVLMFENEEVFERERNRLGGLLLLRGNSNQSSGNERYVDKLRTYAQSLYWNATLNSDTHHSNLDLRDFKSRFDLDISPMSKFGPEELEVRHRLLSKMISIIWS
ncbi:DUF262 domain-containing protein [Chryseobacterium indoltheticum]|uniref:DUF262 domain-containing protein n=1 Tax=Chryseobacterium indoltheticum TaxID=254 RepID=A0A3G6N3I0_9FLAO|nr:DUF262 domain-containing protein [Chryseobacterium indoltheticum]AZA60076.1 DUF262 domain-containing protein [Chryseobacterium indoltheticum]